MQACVAVTELYGRTFATWTLTTCALCLICAKNPRVPAIYGEHCSNHHSMKRAQDNKLVKAFINSLPVV